MRTVLVLLIGCAVVSTACSTTQVVRPLPRGSSQLSFSVGGPLVPDKVVTQVVPYATFGWQRGVSDALTLGGSVHGTMAAFGVAGADVSATRLLLGSRDDAVALAGTLQAYVFSGRGGTRGYPAASLVGSWKPGEKTLLYSGGTAVVQFEGAPSTLFSPLVGVQRTVRGRLGLQAEFKWMAANANTSAGVFDGESSIGGRGAMAVQVGAILSRGGAR